MGRRWPKVIRDPVHNIIPFEDSPCDQLLLGLVNTREVQPLRRIKQLGMSEMVFPGANHSRFSHSVGVMYVARMMLERVDRLRSRKTTEDQRTAVLAAALLHDVGHGPFSHAFEKVSGEDHEARTLEIILDPDTEVSKRLRAHDKELPERLAIFFDEDIDAGKRRKAAIPEFLTQIVSSQLDADRFDYLLRDSYATGAGYGRFDLDWLFLHLQLDGEQGAETVTEKYRWLAAVIAAHPNHRVVGRTRLQKTVRLLQRLGAPLDYAYMIHFYGPYSEGVQADIGLLENLGMVTEEAKTNREGAPYSILIAGPEAIKLASAAELKPFLPAIKTMRETDAVVLELAATYDAFRKTGDDHKTAIERLGRKKGTKCDNGRVQKAMAILKTLGLNVSWARPVPTNATRYAFRLMQGSAQRYWCLVYREQTGHFPFSCRSRLQSYSRQPDQEHCRTGLRCPCPRHLGA
jgi:uncharacterized protein YwgA